MPPKKRSYPLKVEYEKQLGVRIGERDAVTGRVLTLQCLFCQSFGREEVAASEDGATIDCTTAEAAEAARAPTTASLRKRGRTANAKSWTVFRSDNMRDHMKEQHPRKWAEYEELLNKCAPRTGGALASEEERERLKLFFRATHIPAYFSSHALKPISVQVSSRVVRFIHASLMEHTGVGNVDGAMAENIECSNLNETFKGFGKFSAVHVGPSNLSNAGTDSEETGYTITVFQSAATRICSGIVGSGSLLFTMCGSCEAFKGTVRQSLKAGVRESTASIIQSPFNLCAQS
jgi:hypothetical protein